MADIVVAGSTGLIGSAFLRAIKNKPAFAEVVALTRRKFDPDAANIKPLVVDFGRLAQYRNELKADSAFCALGTTIKKAGSKENFRRVDYKLPLDFARTVLENNCRTFILISAVGADPNSSLFYSRIKGELEVDLQTLSFKSIHILRPSLLVGQRKEFRIGEAISQLFLAPIRRLIPVKYRPIHADAVARKVIDILYAETTGIHIYEGAALHG